MVVTAFGKCGCDVSTFFSYLIFELFQENDKLALFIVGYPLKPAFS